MKFFIILTLCLAFVATQEIDGNFRKYPIKNRKTNGLNLKS